ncbi:MAG: hypothetical protein IPL53_06480 [Ignavibacteria bacterium]|nr:hypothetical protein [Ignavibacteria bacterium]
MQKNLLYLFLLSFCCVFFIRCNTATPEEYFNVAVLNTNMLSGFATNGMLRQIGPPSAGEEMKTKIKFLEENFEKVKDLKETDDTKDMIKASLNLYEYVLPVYKTEYVQLADLVDKGAPEDQIQSFDKSIQEKYYPQYEALYDKLIRIGKSYAAKHNIKVNWGDE